MIAGVYVHVHFDYSNRMYLNHHDVVNQIPLKLKCSSVSKAFSLDHLRQTYDGNLLHGHDEGFLLVKRTTETFFTTMTKAFPR